MPRRDEYDDYHRDDNYDDHPDDRRDRDPQRDDYDDEPRTGSRAWAARKVTLPAIFLMVVGGLGFGFTVFRTVILLIFGVQPNPFANPNAPNAADMQKIQEVAEIAGPFINLAWSLIVFFGGLQLKRLRGRGFVIFSCIWAMLPCNLVCLLGIPFGIWALVVACNSDVTRAFNMRPRPESF